MSVPTEAELAADAARMDDVGRQLADAVVARLPEWVEGAVARVLSAWHESEGRLAEPPDPGHLTAAQTAATRAVDDIGQQVRELLAQDIDAQRVNPLTLVRRAVKYPTEVLSDAGVPPVIRDAFTEKNFPADVYDISPATFADIHPDLHDIGLLWGAAKAHLHLRRRRAEGRR